MSAKQSKKTKKQRDLGLQRLQRVMAAAGVGSRRESEIVIQEGRVEIDGEVVMELGVKVDPSQQDIFVDGQKLAIESLQYFILNKPPGVVSTSSDPSGRARVIDLIKTENRVYNVGRLDRSSEGLILVTNDGDLANRLTHPRYGVAKKYHVLVAGLPAPGDLRKLKDGIHLAEGRAKAVDVKFLRKVKNSSWLEIVLDEGRNREIRRMLAAIGHKVRTLRRVSIGPLKLKDLPVGAHRPLTVYELRALKRATSDDFHSGKKPRKKKSSSTKKTNSKSISNLSEKSDSEQERATSKTPGTRLGRPRADARTGSPKKKSGSPSVRRKPSKKKVSKRRTTAKSEGSRRGAARNITTKRSASKKPTAKKRTARGQKRR